MTDRYKKLKESALKERQQQESTNKKRKSYEQIKQEALSSTEKIDVGIEANDVEAWFKNVSDTSKKVRSYFSNEGYKRYDNEIGEALQKAISQSKDVEKYIKANRNSFKDYEKTLSDFYDTANYLKSAASGMDEAEKFYSEWDSADEYEAYAADALKISELYNMSSSEIEEQMGVLDAEFKPQYDSMKAELQELNNSIIFYNRGDRSKFKTYADFEAAKEKRDTLKEKLAEIDNKTNIAYTTSGGENITWKSLYDKKKDEEDFNALYAEMSEMTDWSEQSKYIPTYNLNDALSYFTADADYEDANHFTATANGTIDRYYALQTNEQEKELFNYLAHTKGTDYAVDWLMSREDVYKERARNEHIKTAQKFAREMPVISDAVAVLGSLVSPLEYVVDIASGNAGDKSDSALFSSAIKGTRMEQVDWNIGAWDAFDFLYGTGTSLAESALAMGVYGGAGGVSLGLNAAAQSTNDALDRGMSKGQAFVSGVASGIFEGVFESWQIGAFSDLTKNLKRADFKNLAKYVGKNMWNNAKEETLTEIANIAYDTFMNGDFSQAETSIRQYMNSGLSESEAKTKVAIELGAQIVESGASGALMGFGFGGAGAVKAHMANINSNAVTKPLSSYSKEKQGNIIAFLNSADSKLRDFVQRVKGGNSGFERHEISKVSEREATDINNLLGIDVSGYTHNINTNGVQHILNRHGENGNHDTSMSSDEDIARVGWVLGNYDSVEKIDNGGSKEFRNSDNVPATQVRYIKKIDGTYYVVEAAFENKHKKLWVQSAYLQKNNEDVTQAPNADGNISPEMTAETALASPSSDTTIHQNEQNVNTHKFEVSEDGQAYNKKTGQSVNISEIASIKDGKMKLKLDSGETVDAEDIEFATEDEAVIYSAITEIGNIVDAHSANSILSNYDSQQGIPAGVYAQGAIQAYSYGFYGYSPSGMMNPNMLSSELTETQRTKLYELGQGYAKSIELSEQAKAQDGNKNAVSHKVYFDQGNGKISEFDLSKAKLSDNQRAGVETAMYLTKLEIGADFYFFKSYEKNGKRIYRDYRGREVYAPNGIFHSDGRIYVDLNAGVSAKGLTLHTLSHELTHFIKEYSPQKYRQLAKVLIKEYEKSGADVNAIVLAKQKRLSILRKESISYDEAFHEVVADSFVKMFDDGKMYQTIEKLKKLDKGIVEKIKEFFGNIANKIARFQKSAEAESFEGKYISDVDGAIERMRNAFAEALVDASSNFNNSSNVQQKNTTDDGDVKNSDRDFVEYNKPIMPEDVQILRSIGRKSINDFSNEDIVKSQKWAYKFYQQLGTKSPFFRAWFGDWREYEHLKFVNILQMEYREGKNPRGEYKNKDTGWIINSSSVGYDETVSHSGKDKKSIIAMRNIDKIIENAILLDTEVSEHGRGKKSIYTSFMHKFYAPIRISNNIYVAKMAVEESYAPGKADTNKKFYHVRAIEIETVSSVGIGKNHTPIMEDTVSNISISKLFALVKRCDSEFKPHSANKVLLNEDGTPKVFYHGTDAVFTEFNTDNQRTNGKLNFGKGIYLTPNKSLAEMYTTTGNVMELYASVKNPYEIFSSRLDESDLRKLSAEFGESVTLENIDTVLQKNKYDGIIARNYNGTTNPISQIVVFNSNQVKSATDNIGTFDGNNPNIRFSDRDSSAVSNRSLLANALEATVKDDTEKAKLAEYKDKIKAADEQEAKLSQLNAEIKELSFAKGPRDTAKIRALRDEAIKTANRIDLIDKQLLRFEAAKPLRNVLEREKQKAMKKQKAKDAEILKEYKEKSLAKLEETRRQYQESRKKNVEGRQKTEIRNKIKKTVKKLNHLLIHGSKEHNIKIELQDTARKAVLAAEQLFDKDGGEGIGECLSKLRFAYDTLAMSENKLAKDAYNAETSQKLLELQNEIGESSLSELSKATLEKTCDCFKLIYSTITNVNKLFKDGKAIEINSLSWSTINEIEEIGTRVNNNHSKIVGEAIDKIDSFSWAEHKPVYAFERMGSKTLMGLYWDAVKADGVCARSVDDAATFMNEQKRKYGYISWDLDNTKTFVLEGGKEFKLTISDIMSIYAYSKREQAHDHIIKGGFMFTKGKTFTEGMGKNKKVISIEKLQNTSETYRLNADILAKIVGSLTEQQRNYVDSMQDYLSSVMGEKGNEVSRILYGIDLFKEKHYFPLKSSTDFLNSVQEALQKTPTQTSLKNIGMAKETTPHASNPIMLESFEDVWKSHVIKMSQYNAYVIPIENLQKIFNFERVTEKGTVSVKNTINRVHGVNASQYIDNWIIDLNGGMDILGYKSPLMKRFATFKKVKTAASLSTTIQQYSAVVRATALVDSKYFVSPKRLGKTVKLGELYQEMREHAPIVIVKEIGGFDVGSTGSAMEYMSFGEYDTFGNKFKGFFTDKDYAKKAADDMFMAGATAMDKLGWMAIWSAVKNEIAAEMNMPVGSKEFFDACSKRFTEVIAYTQVYDSVVSRSGIMRSKGDLNKFATAFMGEPTTSINMLLNAALQVKRAKQGSRFKAVRNFARVSGAVYSSIILAAISASFIYALRDDEDEDESLVEKWAWEFGGKLRDEINPLNMLPYARDIISIAQGYTIERPDMSLIADVIGTFKDVQKALTSEQENLPAVVMDLAQQVAAFYGIPLGNIIRDTNGIINGIRMITDDVAPSQVGYAFVSGWRGEENSLKNKAIAAFESGDYNKCKENVNAMVALKVDEDTTEKQARSAVKSSFTRTYKELYLDAVEKGDFDEMNQIRKLLYATGLYQNLSAVDAVLKKWRME